MVDETKPNTAKSKKMKPIQILRERRGGVPRDLIERNRQQSVIRRRITKALQGEPMTVPELADHLDVPSSEVLWYVMGMKKYGKVIEAEQAGSYFKYRLADESRETEIAS